MNFKELDIRAITKWCIENGQDKMDWLVKFRNTPQYPKDKKGNEDTTKEKVIPGINAIKAEFARVYRPDLLATKSGKKYTMDDLINAMGKPEYEAIAKAYEEQQERAKALKAQRKAKKEEEAE